MTQNKALDATLSFISLLLNATDHRILNVYIQNYMLYTLFFMPM